MIDPGQAERREVRWFAEAMEERLRANDHKPGWRGSGVSYFCDRLREEVEELLAESWRTGPDAAERVLREAADVANFAMMIADVFDDAIGTRANR